MIIRSARFNERPEFNGLGGDIDCNVNYHIDGGPDTVTFTFMACNGRHSTSVYLSVDGAKKLRDAINEVLGEQQ
jgi:hypothetical protein